MKKILYLAALMLAAALTFASCVGKQETQQIERRLEVNYTVKCSQDLIDALDLVVTYKDKGGINSTDTVRDTLWTKTVVHDVIPAKVGFDWSVTPKSAAKHGKDTLNLVADLSLSYNGASWRRPYMFTYLDFPTSRLETLCDLINLQRENMHALDKNNQYFDPCYIIRPCRQNEIGIDGLMTEIAHWNDDK